jgi:dynactin complex subunit
MENDKFQELALDHLVRLTQDNTEIKQNIQEINQRLEKVELAVIRIENDHGDKLQALFDAREAQVDVNERIFDALNRIEGKVDRLALKVSSHEAVLKKVK